MNRIIVRVLGETSKIELYSPFAHLRTLTGNGAGVGSNEGGSSQFQSSPSQDHPLNQDVERFLSMLRFEQRDKLADLPVDIAQLSDQMMLEAQDSR